VEILTHTRVRACLCVCVSLSLSFPVSLSVFVCVYIYTHKYIHIYICTHTHTHTYIYIFIYIYKCTHTTVCLCVTNTPSYLYICMLPMYCRMVLHQSFTCSHPIFLRRSNTQRAQPCQWRTFLYPLFIITNTPYIHHHQHCSHTLRSPWRTYIPTPYLLATEATRMGWL